MSQLIDSVDGQVSFEDFLGNAAKANMKENYTLGKKIVGEYEELFYHESNYSSCLLIMARIFSRANREYSATDLYGLDPLLIRDDGSKDKTREIIKRFALEDDRITFYQSSIKLKI